MYRVNTSLLNDISQDDIITDSEHEILIREGCPKDWFEKVRPYEVGDWVVVEKYDFVFRINNFENQEVWGSGINGTSWQNDTNFCLLKQIDRKATPEEIEQALITEWKKRLDGRERVKLKNLYSGLIGNYCFGKDKFQYYPKKDELHHCALCVYKQGEFATIEDTTPTIGKFEVKDCGNGKQVGCMVFPQDTIDNLGNAIASYGLKLYLNGEDISGDVSKFANFEDLPF